MFEDSSVLVICADSDSTIMRIEIDADTQKSICHTFAEAVQSLTSDKEKVEFDGKYKPEQDEILHISNFQLADEIKDAVRNPIGVTAYEETNGEYPQIKAVFVGEKVDDGDTERFSVAFQRFRKEQYISTANFNLFWSKNTFRHEKSYGISISDSIDCFYAPDEELQFTSFYYARQVFDLSGYYRSATTQEVTSFTSNESLSFENAESFETMANSSIRRKIAAINDSEVLKKYQAIEIKRLAQKSGITITVKNKQIVIPNDKEQIKVILGFLDEEAYKGPFSQILIWRTPKERFPISEALISILKVEGYVIISKIRVQNYKLLKDVCIPINPDINVFVGENDAGKSTLLEVISIITSGKLNGYAFSKQIKDNMFNIDVRNAYIASLNGNEPIAPPKIIMEAYCANGDALYSGSNNLLSEDVAVIRVVAEFDNQYERVYKEMLVAGEVKDIPVEFYRADCKYFSGEPVSYRYCPIKSVFVDTTRKDYTGVVDRFVSENITQYLSPEDQVDLSIAYRKVRANFSNSGTITKLNEELKKGQALNGRVFSLELRENDVDEWKRQMAISIDTIPFEQIGFGTQNTIKVELAIAHDAEEVNMILMEEPENCLSHTNMAKLVHRVSSTEGKQIFISTHSSFIANKLNLGNLLLVEKGEVKPFRDLPNGTINYFKKLPGYDTLRLVLAEKVVLVEGPTDDLIIQRAYKDKKGCLPSENGIDIIAVDSLAFKRYCDIAVILKKKIAVVTDNDGNIALNINEKYSEYKDSPYIRIFYEMDEALNTIEPSVLAVNCDENGAPTEEFKTVISCETSLMNRDYDGILGFMSKNKSEWAARVFDSEASIHYPAYIKELIDEYC